MNGRNSVKIDFMLSGELAQRLCECLDKGYFATKPEAVRQALRHMFAEIDEKEFRRARLRMIEN